MIDQIILLAIILAPCIAFVGGALLFSLVSALRDSIAAHAHQPGSKASTLSFNATFRLNR